MKVHCVCGGPARVGTDAGGQRRGLPLMGVPLATVEVDSQRACFSTTCIAELVSHQETSLAGSV